MSNFNLQQFYGVGGAPLIEAIVEKVKATGVSNDIAIIVLSLALSFGWNLLLGWYVFGYDLKSVVAVTIYTAVASNIYHEVTTPSKQS